MTLLLWSPVSNPVWAQAPGPSFAPANDAASVGGTIAAPELPLPAFLDDRRLQAIENSSRPRVEANEQRRAEKLKRKAVEADVKRKAEEIRRAVDEAAAGGIPTASTATRMIEIIQPAQAIAAPAPAPAPPPPSDARPPSPAVKAVAGTLLPLVKPSPPCKPGSAATAAMPGGRLAISIEEPCRAGEAVTIHYAPYLFVRTLDGQGTLRFVLDLFQGALTPLALEFEDGGRRALTIGETDIDRVSKIAVVWGQPVNLDMHAYEYVAEHGGPGHVWAQRPSSAEAALDETLRTKRARGFMSWTSEGTQPGHQVEVYTVWHHAEQTGGVVSTALDFETRGATLAGRTCGSGPLASIPFETLTLRPRSLPVRERGIISPLPCGETLIERARYMDEAVADMPLGGN